MAFRCNHSQLQSVRLSDVFHDYIGTFLSLGPYVCLPVSLSINPSPHPLSLSLSLCGYDVKPINTLRVFFVFSSFVFFYLPLSICLCVRSFVWLFFSCCNLFIKRFPNHTFCLSSYRIAIMSWKKSSQPLFIQIAKTPLLWTRYHPNNTRKGRYQQRRNTVQPLLTQSQAYRQYVHTQERHD